MASGKFIEGVKRSGKTKYAVDLINDYLKRGRKVATNLDLFLDKMPVQNPHVIRLPDHPRSEDLHALGIGYPELEQDDRNYDESKNGLVVIDELLTHLNSRSFKDKDRLAIVSWFVQMGKYGWDLVLIGQDFEGVDKQLRDTTIDQLVSVKSGVNYFGFGFINSVVQRVFSVLHIPKFSVARFYDGKSKSRKAHGYQFYIKDWTHAWYNTAQKFLPDVMTAKDGRLIDMRAMYSMVPTEQLKKWYLVKDRVNEVIEENKKTKAKDPILKTWHKAALFCLVGYITYLFYPFGDDSSESTSTASSSTPKERTNVQHELPEILNGVYITCSVISTKQNSTYCFEKDGNPFYPSSIDAVVNVVSACTAKLTYMDSEYTIHCLPYRVDSFSAAKPINSTPIEQDLIAAN
ncbi:zonular occludens toxin domain-containing protein [Pseudoalteromonas lipolytica]|uniref:Zonular occludens toxin (Zot) n=1 Tax=Pseudoalteromonas lipolytica TaxID=570156 RepID=A0ABY1GMN0_9GAMM|nr:zonular occludens toxin domain-containing protein [Pseudoalteromonas lipolytica]MBE0349280.1 hypothetical protein [Pseudoalteromonas lipolytica LMEB 39]SFT74539.1 Zonular occludens toxin (Zot) [Pseudoalteromonas lipolytica]